MLLVGLIAAGGALVLAQEREIPKDSERVTLRGCARGRAFVVGARTEDQPGTLEIEAGRRLRLNGSGKVLDEIKKRERTMVEITGLIKKSDVPQQGIAIAGGRVRIGGAMPPQAGRPQLDAPAGPAMIDVESFRSLAESCPDK
jgi:hypothetical protein